MLATGKTRLVDAIVDVVVKKLVNLFDLLQ